VQGAGLIPKRLLALKTEHGHEIDPPWLKVKKNKTSEYFMEGVKFRIREKLAVLPAGQ
jgi:hypothetical protein